jgi:hypothetical protein
MLFVFLRALRSHNFSMALGECLVFFAIYFLKSVDRRQANSLNFCTSLRK